MNWGKKILVVYIVFVAGIILLVLKSSSQKMDLVTTDYYAKELKFQDKIDEQNRVDALSDSIHYQIKENGLLIIFPKDFVGKDIVGEAVLYSPSNEDNDVKVPFFVKEQKVEIPLSNVRKGFYVAKLSWKADGISYYQETNIQINK